MKKTLCFRLAVAFTFFSILFGSNLMAAELSVSTTNLTNGIYFTPLLITAHSSDTHLFRVGTMASSELQAMAEGGDISGLISALGGTDGDTIENPAQGLLGPGSTATADLTTEDLHTRLSLVAMLVPTNDGFVGLDSLEIPSSAGVYTYYLNGYDAGTEANDELITGGGAPGEAGIPVDPGEHGGTGGTGVTSTEANAYVHIHRGIVGDMDPQGGVSDLDSAVHRWLNPVAKLTVTVTDPTGSTAAVSDDLATFTVPFVQYMDSFFAVTMERVDGLEYEVTNIEPVQ